MVLLDAGGYAAVRVPVGDVRERGVTVEHVCGRACAIPCGDERGGSGPRPPGLAVLPVGGRSLARLPWPAARAAALAGAAGHGLVPAGNAVCAAGGPDGLA